MSALDADRREYFLVEKGASLPAARSAAAAAPLPRQIRINSYGIAEGRLSPYRAKKQFAVRMDVEGFGRQWGEDFLTEFTLTFAWIEGRPLTDKAEASKRFNSLLPGLRALGMVSHIGCWERQKSGAWHLHMVAAWEKPVKNQTGARKYLESLRLAVCGTKANEHHDGLLMKRRFGYQHHLEPIKKTTARFANYFTKYLTKSWAVMTYAQKRVRLITYARNVIRSASVHFAWNGPRGRNWRHRAELWAKSKGCPTPEACVKKFGPQWEYKNRKAISEMVIPSYRSDMCDIADNFRFIPFEEAFMMGFRASEYWQKLRIKEGLPVSALERNGDGSIIRYRTDRKAEENPF
jgi:hypothetical protein